MKLTYEKRYFARSPMNIRIAGLADDSIVDGPGLRFSVFMQGCPHKCPGCHNPETHDTSGGKLMSTQEILHRIRMNPLISGVTFTGGEPIMQIEPLIELSKEVKKLGLDIIVYTGYLWEELLKDVNCIELLKIIDVIIDGKFEIEQQSLSLDFIGSKNQRIIDVRKSMESGFVSFKEV